MAGEIASNGTEECALIKPPQHVPFEIELKLGTGDLRSDSFPTVLPTPLMRMSIARAPEAGIGWFTYTVKKTTPVAIDVQIVPENDDHTVGGFGSTGMDPVQDVNGFSLMTDGQGQPVNGGLTLIITEVTG
jgi:hypothetical protein